MKRNADSPRLGLNGDSVGAETDREEESNKESLMSVLGLTSRQLLHGQIKSWRSACMNLHFNILTKVQVQTSQSFHIGADFALLTACRKCVLVSKCRKMGPFLNHL